MCVRTLMRLAGGVLLISFLSACGGGGGNGTTATFAIGGLVSGLSSGTGISVVLENGSDMISLTQDGNFVFPTKQAYGSTYDVTVSSQPPFPQRCSVASGTGTVGATVTDVAVTCNTPVTTVYTFQNAATEGNDPQTQLVFDNRGNLYGTTVLGGATGVGTVFELIPNGSGGYTDALLHSFSGGTTDGSKPEAVILDSQGNLYGTTSGGGTAGDGILFELEPNGVGGATETVLYSFVGGSIDGSQPDAGLVMDSQGNLYGTTEYGGPENDGTVFELKPNGSGGYTESVIHGFSSNGGDGATPAALVLDSQGNLYGTTALGGAGYGIAFELEPNGSGGFTESVLYNFLGGSDSTGGGPMIIDTRGDLYGTGGGGGSAVNGTVFELTPNGSGGYGESVLYRFAGGTTDGANPIAVTLDSQGNLYGTTAFGGSEDDGTVFELKPDGSGGYTESVIYNFTGETVGPGPGSGLTFDSQGNLYGTDLNEIDGYYGSVFEMQ